MTKTQQALVDAMKDAVRDGRWVIANSDTIRYTETLETPEYAHGKGFGKWPHETYTRHQFLTVGPRGVIYGVARAPWVGRTDQNITYRRAFEILANPGEQW